FALGATRAWATTGVLEPATGDRNPRLQMEAGSISRAWRSVKQDLAQPRASMSPKVPTTRPRHGLDKHHRKVAGFVIRRPDCHDRRNQRINSTCRRGMRLAFVNADIARAVGDRDGIRDCIVEQGMLAVNHLPRVGDLGEL